MGGGYAVTGQLEDIGYAAKLYNAENGLPTSDANYIMAASDGYIWIGGYSGIIKYDGSDFERLDPSGGLTSGRVIYEDSKGRIWAGTNDNGAVLMDGSQRRHYTYKDGLASSSVRGITEDGNGNVWLGLTAGIAYVGGDGELKKLDDERINSASVQRLVTGADGIVYGNTRNGEIFAVSADGLISFRTSDELGINKITTVFADPESPGTMYFGTDGEKVYRGAFGAGASELTEISAAPADGICWITRACGHIWINSNSTAGWLDENDTFHVLRDMPLNNAIEMMTADYQGNLWFASTRQGVMKVAATNFRDITDLSGLSREVVNAVCIREGQIYIGTDKGLDILGGGLTPVENELTALLDGIRIRCLTADSAGDLWISTYTDGMGLIRWSPSGEIKSFTEADGLADNGVRCTTEASDGSLLVGTNGGLSVIRNGVIERNIDRSSGISNSVFLTVEEGADGKIYVGTDGGGIYVIDGENVTSLGRDDGLTSDVILRIKRDDKHGVLWIITSNSVEYMRDGVIREIESFPYNNNFDLYSGIDDDIWILSSFGIFRVNALDMLDGGDLEYEVCGAANGLTSIPTANSFSALSFTGDLYIAGRTGVCAVNIYRYTRHKDSIKTGIRSFICGDGEIYPDSGGVYTISPEPGRIQINAAVLDYTLTDPLVRIFLEGDDDPGITASHSGLVPLEFTGLPYGKYTFHIQILNGSDGSVFEDNTFTVVKQPRFFELIGVRIALVVLLVLAAGLIVWRVMTNTVIRRQYEQIRAAKEEAERANSAKSRFLANMSHEIRTPINTIMGMDEMILREDAENVPDEYFKAVTGCAEDIKNASESLLSLVNDLLDMSKIESGKMHLVEQEYDTVDLIRSVVSMIRVRASQKGLTFETDVDENLPKRLYGDAGKIKQIVLNLLTNAVKYTEKGGFVLKVSGERDGEKCAMRVSVKDTGIGVKPEDMEKLFTAYERLDEEKNSGIQGTGLGLDISRRFAELMDGKLWCESVYGEGSEFILTFTQGIVDGESIGGFTEHSTERGRGGYKALFTAPDARVLVTDDNPMNLNVAKGLLKATKVGVTTAASGEECLELLKEQSFDIVFLDHMMPGMDGIKTVARIREDHPDLPVYALTANITAGGEDFYRTKGFDGYLSKPIDSPALERAIMMHLPPELICAPEEADTGEEQVSLPEDMLWLNDIDGISPEEGIRNAGGVSSYISSLKMFADTLDENSSVIENAYSGGDIRLYTVKVHALKSSARIIGASGLSALAQELENAGNAGDMDFIRANTDRFLSDYRAYKEKLSPLCVSGENVSGEPIPEDELRDAYSALSEVIPQMDYDSVEMIIGQLKEYRLPEKDAEKISALEGALRRFDWDAMEALMNEE
ncbi:MAG: response regulator [Ruminiclostridium sp.]|nr:response regulator [Ruminiclostridium sp.]